MSHSAYIRATAAHPERDRSLPDECLRWLEVAVLCWFWVVCGLCFMGAVNALYWPF